MQMIPLLCKRHTYICTIEKKKGEASTWTQVRIYIHTYKHARVCVGRERKPSSLPSISSYLLDHCIAFESDPSASPPLAAFSSSSTYIPDQSILHHLKGQELASDIASNCCSSERDPSLSFFRSSRLDSEKGRKGKERKEKCMACSLPGTAFGLLLPI